MCITRRSYAAYHVTDKSRESESEQPRAHREPQPRHIRHEWHQRDHSQATLSPEPLPALTALQKVFTRINTAGPHSRTCHREKTTLSLCCNSPKKGVSLSLKTSLMASARASESGTVFCSKPVLPLLLLLLVAASLQGPLRSDASPILSSHQRQRPDPGLGDGHGGVVDLSELERDGAVNAQLLESLKEQFVRTFNLSGSGPQLSVREEPPEYMMELYNRFANDHDAMPTANIIRSFKNEDLSPSVIDAEGVRRHRLLFNVSVPHHERVTAAELRLYTLVQTDRDLYAGVDRKVTIFELESNEEETNTTEESQEEKRSGRYTSVRASVEAGFRH
ncbi:hypothetical protein WMY93_004294 [Mugilogobius chulae]|uniref:TGF-beta propeptide domain-containing protein n=1 Tax=Mugilogobius chulae TaxID=88201 RepID=A0AAW0PQQ0_9GOBI